ncbi:hypothetical protein P3342_006922 [Pyrenophora teres f. teres]|uniref:Copper-fist domain-containing protein n=2 Tax=Pyrenophora teres f. teres TaxID=97479 RepID=E3S986_PYRTT|nr:hypothetical protein PTT_19583 [Pyrenophora teres f. teres 0-1]KAE8833636.1 hypothetical protein HRS9139_05455 [Pyrenophora teres f. teres]KAE8840597.1 hypothetical protein PTNB85_03996 [Pyrenophora teres f. teres]KAE8849264.1 hypothetical protein HRS9122_03280 [Pyrenophora teres f. teres]KAE8864091.1 hypothetical protein PTNB29_04055 [Pyrenophora teres f. teres]
MWAEVNGERKKVACGPCIRGHRSSKCDHRDRVLVEVRKPGRPLSSCPHPTGSCSCERVVINYTIPKSSECGCPSERAPPTATVVGNSRISKPRRKSAAVNTFNIEKAIRSGLDAETETSSITHTPSETSGSNATSLPSSASSTPRLLPAQHETISSCCKPKPALSPVQEGGCCGKKSKPAPEPAVQKKSCCSSSNKPASAPANHQPNGYQHIGQQFQFPAQPQFMMSQYQSFQPQTSTTPTPFGLGTPIYNHAAAAYHQHNSMPLSPVTDTPISPHGSSPQVRQHVPEHNCHCGESCSCFGCAAHPNNATMMEYIRVMAQFQYTGGFGGMAPPFYDIPTYPHQAGYGAEATQGMPFSLMQQSMTTSTPTQMSFSANVNIANRPMSMPVNWQQPITPMTSMSQGQFPSTTTYTSSAPMEPTTPSKTEDIAGSPVADSPADSKDEETSTLSPSSYFWNQVTLPGCSDASGTCQCGDGCACVGCLTHGGHTGEQLEDIAAAEHDAFPDFGPALGVDINDASNFIDFTAGPS